MNYVSRYFFILILALLPLQGHSVEACGPQLIGLNSPKSQSVKKLDDSELLEISKKMEISLYSHDVELRKVLLQKGFDENRGFRRMSGKGYWKFRVKTADSIFKKLQKKSRAGADLTDLASAQKLLGDGLGARFVLFDPSSENFQLFTDDIIELIKSKELTVMGVENYYGPDGKPYLTNTQVQNIVEAQRSINPNAMENIIDGAGAVRDTGYTSIHINAALPSGAKVEIQVRSGLLEQLGEVSHIFYDEVSGKKIALHVEANSVLKEAVETIKKLNGKQKKIYNQYLAAAFKVVRRYSLGERIYPLVFPKQLKKFSNLSIDKLATAFDFQMLRDLIVNPNDFDHRKEIYKVYDSISNLTQFLSDDVLEKVLGNVSQGSVLRTKQQIIQGELDSLNAELAGLKSLGAIVWEESEHLRHRRKVIRSGEKWPVEINLPEYKLGQKTGLQTLRVADLHYMQDSANNASGEYTVIGNAKALQNGSLKASDLPPLQVWQDTTGKIWSLDHRRLAAFDLSGVVDKVEVIVVEKDIVDEDKFKLSNSDGGKSIIIHRDEDNLAYIIVKP